jgi:hypothetical protein
MPDTGIAVWTDIQTSPEKLQAFRDYCKMLVDSKMLPVSTVEQVQAAHVLGWGMGITLAEVFNRYHMIPFRDHVQPSLKSIWVMGEFQRIGGVINWTKISPEGAWCTASYNGVEADFEFTMEEAKRRGMAKGKPAWFQDPGTMCMYRCGTRVAKALAPSILGGQSVDVDVQDAQYQVVEAREPAEPVSVPAIEQKAAPAPQEPPQDTEEKPPKRKRGRPRKKPEPAHKPLPGPIPEESLSGSGSYSVHPTEPEPPKDEKPPEDFKGELSRKLKEHGLGPLQAKDALEDALGREIQGWDDVTEEDAKAVLGKLAEQRAREKGM